MTAPPPGAKEPEMICTLEPVTGTRARESRKCASQRAALQKDRKPQSAS